MALAINFIIMLIMGAIGAKMADERGRSSVGGFFLGFFLTLIGLAIIALMGDKR